MVAGLMTMSFWRVVASNMISWCVGSRTELQSTG
jgi:hypothetical protein